MHWPLILPAASGEMNNQTLALIGGLAVVVFLMTMSMRRRQAARGGSPREYVREQLHRMKEHQGIREDISEVMMQLEKLSREINAQVDIRFAKLEKAIADADARLAELRRLGLGNHESPTPLPKSAGAPEAKEVSPAGDVTPPANAQESLASQVLESVDAGLSYVEIARRLNRNVGEIELIVKLRRPRNPQDV